MNSLGIDKSPADTRIVVAMSGGVDSSVTAGLMVEAGYEVIGITLQLYNHGMTISKPGACCAGQDIRDAGRVAEKLGIPHYVLNYESLFRDSVIDDFADTYLRGETPIPCVRCNQTVKFRDLMGAARDLNADVVVTGHYVRSVAGANGREMHRARDLAKDQSYFLFATTVAQLGFLQFPLGDIEKAVTRLKAARFGLAVADKPESQDICFVPDGDYARLVRNLRPGACKLGEIVDLDGNILGEHQGVIGFTVGQRRGLGISSVEPFYVIRLEPETRRVVVGPREALARTWLKVAQINWLGDGELEAVERRIEAKIRSTGSTVPATLRGRFDDSAEIVFDQPEFGIAPGQACVFYDGERVLGGGWIVRD